jgi:hypothetical protein
VDLDGDGIGDIITGSWPGELYFFKGKGKGEFATPVKLQRDGKDINLGRASTVFAADWRGTGQLDLLVGDIEGNIFLVPNNGSNLRPSYGKPQKLEAGGQPIKAPDGDSQPVVADWDGDGLLDLIVGCGDGSVIWYRNVGSKTEPMLAKGVRLVRPAPVLPVKNPRGMRAKVCVVDWTGNGHLDLLIGDFGVTFGPEPKLSEDDKKLQTEAKAKLESLQSKLQPFYDEYRKKSQEGAKPDDSMELRTAREKKALEVFNAKECRELQSEQGRIYQTMQKFGRPYTYRGNVWLFLRKAPTAASR